MKVTIENLGGREIDVSADQSLLQGVLNAGVDWMHACGGKGRCTTCKGRVIKGSENFTPESPAEKRYRDQQLLRSDERLICQVRIRDAVVLQVPDESKLPHLQYTSAE